MKTNLKEKLLNNENTNVNEIRKDNVHIILNSILIIKTEVP